jgi:peptidoglycan/xylan/chitin deacetylase (PgdA/CDA1 family)
MRRLLGSLLVSRVVTRIFARNQIVAFNLHRVGVIDTLMGTTALAELRFRIQALRRMGYVFLDLRDLCACLLESRPLSTLTRGRPGVFFTIDDGYHDVRAAAELFNQERCPLTVFLTTDFIDGEHWMWWDKVEHVLRSSSSARQVQLGRGEGRLDCSLDPGEVTEAYGRICGFLKTISTDESELLLLDLADQVGVDLPHRAPDRFRALTWGEVHELEQDQVSFGPHTRSHPILAQCSEERMRSEIAGSWEDLCRHVSQPVPVFAYPNGDRGSFGARERARVQSEGLVAGVTTLPAFVSDSEELGERYDLPRFPYPEDTPRFFHTANGLRRLVRRTVRRI